MSGRSGKGQSLGQTGGGILGGPVLQDDKSLRQRMYIIVFLSIVSNLLALVQPVFMLHVYDYALPSQSLPTLAYLTLIAVFLICVSGTLDFVRSRIFADAAWELDEKLRPVCFKASYEMGKRNRSAGRSVFASDLETVKQFVSSSGPSAYMDLPWTIIFLGALFALSPWLGLLSLIFAVLVLVFAVLNEVSLREYMREGANRARNAQRLAEDVFQATDAIEAMKFAPKAVGRWSSEAEAQAAYSRAAAARSGIWTALVKTARIALQVLILAASAWLVLLGKLTPGVMIAASIIGARALAPIDQAVGAWRSTAAAKLSWGRLGALTQGFSVEEPVRTNPPALVGILAAENVTVVTSAGSPIIAGVSLSIPPGSFVGLIGASGSGKSTLARALSGALTPDGGLVRLDQIDMRNWPSQRLATAIGYMPQSVQLLSGTIAENIRRLDSVDDEGVVAAATRSGAHTLIAGLANGYETPVGDGGHSLSGGQQAMIGLARALYGNPAIVILDEPAAHLDTEGRKAISAALTALRRERKTVILVTHDLQSVRQFDMLVVMRGGRVEKAGKPDEILVPASQSAPSSGPSSASTAPQSAGNAVARTGRPTPVSPSVSVIHPTRSLNAPSSASTTFAKGDGKSNGGNEA
jgi:PrtD family type I secretion system ABC transporter